MDIYACDQSLPLNVDVFFCWSKGLLSLRPALRRPVRDLWSQFLASSDQNNTMWAQFYRKAVQSEEKRSQTHVFFVFKFRHFLCSIWLQVGRFERAFHRSFDSRFR